MKAGPDLALIASLLGDPARSNMLVAMMQGGAMTAGELARHGGVTPQTTSSHLSRLVAGGLVSVRAQGRHRYYGLSDPDVAGVIEGLMGLAARVGHSRVRPGPRDPALREARVCDDHLAGDKGVAMFESLVANEHIRVEGEALALTASGEHFLAELGVDANALRSARRPACRACLDWSVRRNHLAGTVGAALLARFYDLGWAARVADSRVVACSARGRSSFDALFGVRSPADTEAAPRAAHPR